MIEKNKKSNAGKEYGLSEYNFIFFCMIRSILPINICRALDRKNQGVIISVFRRICLDASAYKDKKVYKLWPCTTRPWRHINGPAKFFIYQQCVVRKKSIKLVFEQTGIPMTLIKKHIKEGRFQKDF